VIDRGGTVLLPLDETDEAYNRVLNEAFLFANFKTRSTGRKFVVRKDKCEGMMLFVVPLSETRVGSSKESFSELGSILEEPQDGQSGSNTTAANPG
jgi:hypothetical protein